MSAWGRLSLARRLPLGVLGLLALVSLLGGTGVDLQPREARADYGSGPHCSTISSSTHGAGSHSCHNHAANYWIAASTYRDCAGFGSEEESCTYRTARCRRSTAADHQCGSALGFESYLGTRLTGPYKGDPTQTSVTIAAPPTTAPPTTAPPTTAPPTLVLAPPTTISQSPYCAGGGHRHSVLGGCHGHPAPSCGSYNAVSGWGHRWSFTGSWCITTTTTTPATTTTTLAPDLPVVTPGSDSRDEGSNLYVGVEFDRASSSLTVVEIQTVDSVEDSVYTARGGWSCSAGVDFIRLSSRRVTVNPTFLGNSVTVRTCDDSTVEPDETLGIRVVRVVLGDVQLPVNAADRVATATIRNDDTAQQSGTNSQVH